MAARVRVLVGVAGLAAWSGCIEPQLTYCDDGRACSAELACDEVHHSCVTPGQLAACAGKPDAAACMTDEITGLCFDQVCVVPGCGNSVVEPGELCDDGNRISGDGCSVNCASTESCGNGVIDTPRGETCDDGNLASHDGCNSQCAGESEAWHAYSVHLTSFDRRAAAYDSTRDRLVHLSNTVWEWDGAHWSVSVAAVPILTWQAAAYDPVHSLTIGIATAPTSTTVVVYAWNGDTLVELQTTDAPSAPILATVWDGARQKLLVVTNQVDYYLDVGTAAWSPLVTSITGINSPVLAFNSKTGMVVMYDANSATTYEWDGAGWTNTSTAPRGGVDTALVYDAATDRMLAIGGQSDASAVDLYTTSGGWTDAGFSCDSRNKAFAWYDATLAHVRVMGGGSEDMLEIAGTTTSTVGEPHPAAQQFNGLAYDPKRARLAVFDINGGGYVWSSTWTPLPAAGGNISQPTYDPVREGTLAIVGTQQPEQLVLLRDSLLVPVVVTPTQHQLWERTNGTFKPLGLLPVIGQVSDVTELPSGRTMMLMSGSAGTFMLERQLTSSLPDETCVAGEDADGDGAAGCADPDCWWSCWPACPVATSCP